MDTYHLLFVTCISILCAQRFVICHAILNQMAHIIGYLPSNIWDAFQFIVHIDFNMLHRYLGCILILSIVIAHQISHSIGYYQLIFPPNYGCHSIDMRH